MAFLSFVGRVLFVSVFVLSAVQEFKDFGEDGGSATKALTPKFHVLSTHIATHTGFQVPAFEIKLLIAGAIALKALGSFLFIFGSTIGATLLILHQLIATPILYDFYNYDIEKKEFLQLFIKFAQFGVVWGTLVLHWDEELYPKKIFDDKEGQNKDHLKDGVVRLQQGLLLLMYSATSFDSLEVAGRTDVPVAEGSHVSYKAGYPWEMVQVDNMFREGSLKMNFTRGLKLAADTGTPRTVNVTNHKPPSRRKKDCGPNSPHEYYGPSFKDEYSFTYFITTNIHLEISSSIFVPRFHASSELLKRRGDKVEENGGFIPVQQRKVGSWSSRLWLNNTIGIEEKLTMNGGKKACESDG
ncbi:HR-like lesion-inducer [Tanacetum coccineum]